MTFQSFLSFYKHKNAFFCAVLCLFVIAPFFYEIENAPFWFHEHFFNTLVISRNFLSYGFATFDGVTLTNDFSPLWTAFLALLSFIFPISSPSFFIAIRFVLALGGALNLWLLNKLIKKLGYTLSSQSLFFVLSFQLALYLYIATTGLEYAPLIPALLLNALLGLIALKKLTFKSSFFYGLSFSLCVFLEFSAVCFFITTALVFYFQFDKKSPIPIKDFFKFLPPFILGCLPFLAWLFYQKYTFGFIAPSRCMSWSSVQEYAPWRIFSVLFFEPIRYFFSNFANLALISFSALLLGLVAHASFTWEKRIQTPKDTFFYTLIWFALFCLTLMAGFSYLSLPEYLFYPLSVSAPFALMFATNKIDTQIHEEEKQTAQKAWVILGFLLCIVATLIAIKPRFLAYKDLARAVQTFTKDYEGVYAMGSGAGVSAYLSEKNFVRLDGLAQNKEMLEALHTQKTLDIPLKTFHVDYYIALNSIKSQSCFSTREPLQNRFGGSNKGMNDWLCAEPLSEKQITPRTKIYLFKINENGKAF